MKELKREIIGAVQDSIDLTDNQLSIPTLNIMLDEILPEQLRLYFVSQQRELLIAFFNTITTDEFELDDAETIVDRYLYSN